ncbi:uncharacterized protein BJ171DRAFT_515196 [Polychytrium aggregatum]|uniref:uncharacterized protein n=1 Tax=Polychytrium aggregatum TaxID=110093 RepID=UPI0022FEBD57|nr:uncharacterized protein BJ171DRAFT_515196 [Polychytrium aggregatum]KAI9202209.1 hypothetical protein BJ171DRAFT_515196 [Polychytrium aggregatum]
MTDRDLAEFLLDLPDDPLVDPPEPELSFSSTHLGGFEADAAGSLSPPSLHQNIHEDILDCNDSGSDGVVHSATSDQDKRFASRTTSRRQRYRSISRSSRASSVSDRCPISPNSMEVDFHPQGGHDAHDSSPSLATTDDAPGCLVPAVSTRGRSRSPQRLYSSGGCPDHHTPAASKRSSSDARPLPADSADQNPKSQLDSPLRGTGADPLKPNAPSSAFSHRELPKKEYRIFVSNLLPEVSWRELKDFMRKAGNVLYANVMTEPSGRGRGFGTAAFATVEECQRAIKMLDKLPLMGRPAFLHETPQYVSEPTKPSGIASQVTERPKTTSCNRSGQPNIRDPTRFEGHNHGGESRACHTSAYGHHSGYSRNGYNHRDLPSSRSRSRSASPTRHRGRDFRQGYDSSAHLHRLSNSGSDSGYCRSISDWSGRDVYRGPDMPKCRGVHSRDTRFEVSPRYRDHVSYNAGIRSPGAPNQPYYHQNARICIKNLPLDIVWQDLKNLCLKAGAVVRAKVQETIDHRPIGTGTVLFGCPEDAKKAIAMFDGQEWRGHKLKVCEARSSGQYPIREGGSIANVPRLPRDPLPPSSPPDRWGATRAQDFQRPYVSSHGRPRETEFGRPDNTNTAYRSGYDRPDAGASRPAPLESGYVGRQSRERYSQWDAQRPNRTYSF